MGLDSPREAISFTFSEKSDVIDSAININQTKQGVYGQDETRF